MESFRSFLLSELIREERESLIFSYGDIVYFELERIFRNIISLHSSRENEGWIYVGFTYVTLVLFFCWVRQLR